MGKKFKLTVRFVVEHDYEIEVRDDRNTLAGGFQIGDWMVGSGSCGGFGEENIVNENIFDRPIGRMRGAGENNLFDANLYNLTDGWLCADEIIENPWLVEEIKDGRQAY